MAAWQHTEGSQTVRREREPCGNTSETFHGASEPPAKKLASAVTDDNSVFHGHYPEQSNAVQNSSSSNIRESTAIVPYGTVVQPAAPVTLIDPEIALRKLLNVEPPAWAMSALTSKNGFEEVIHKLDV